MKAPVPEIIPQKEIFVGNPDATVTLMEFGEYESEVCAKANEVVKQLLNKYEGKIKFNFRHFPLTKIHQRSKKPARLPLVPPRKASFGKCIIFFSIAVGILVLPA